MLQDKTPLYALFVFFLIISANYLGELFPCKIQNALSQNIYAKHFFGFLTLVFFVVLVDPIQSFSLLGTLGTGVILYGIFLLLINTNVTFFFLSMTCLAFIYIFNLKKKESEDYASYIDTINDILYVVFAMCVGVGFLIYMGEKKIEYKQKFSYLTFIFGKPSCRHQSPKTKYLQALKSAFN